MPWEEVRRKKEAAAHPEQVSREPLIPRGTYALVDKNQIVLDQSQDVFGESKEMSMTAPKQSVGARGRGAGVGAGGYGGPVGGQNYGGGRPTADAVFQGQQTAQQSAVGAAAGTVIVSEAVDDGN